MRFSEFGLDARLTIPFDECTEIQAKAIPQILKGGDLLGQAKTGTGKTLAFIVPTIHRLLKSSGRGIRALVMSPTRELAQQIAVASEPLSKFKVATATGGSNQTSELAKIRNCDILVATPGRVLDYLERGELNIGELDVLILDEADRLLDQGFKPDLIKIIKLLPKRPRQSLLFSATLPSNVNEIAKLVLQPGYQFISTLQPDEVNVHEKVPQSVYIVELPDLLVAIGTVLASANGKVMLFLPTARSAALVYEVFEKANVWQIHSRMSQSARNKSTEAFRNATAGVLISSDVVARGVDFPNVTHVIQAGLPMNSEQYIHRVGRTGRAGAGGVGILILSPFEASFLRDRQMSTLPITQQVLTLDDRIRPVIEQKLKTLDPSTIGSAWSAWLGYYKAMTKYTKFSEKQLIDMANVFAYQTCLYPGDDKTPPILAKTIGLMGLKTSRNLFNVVSELPGKADKPRQAHQGGPRPQGKPQAKPPAKGPPQSGFNSNAQHQPVNNRSNPSSNPRNHSTRPNKPFGKRKSDE